MDREIRRLAIKQYLKYFSVWFVIAAIVFMIFVGNLIFSGVNYIVKRINPPVESTNTQADPERVFDYADVLSDQEERALREQIQSAEKEYKVHIVLVTGREQVETSYTSWERGMRDYADDFYDDRYYGYDKPRGNGMLLFDNWYSGQEGSWLSTCGTVEDVFGDYEIDRVLDAVYNNISEPYEAYSAYIRKATTLYREKKDDKISFGDAFFGGVVGIIGSVVIALIYMATHIRQKQSVDTTNAYTYMWNNRPEIITQKDDFLRKNVTSVRIPKSTGGSSSSHGGGHHTSRSGVSHGGGGRRR